MTKWSLDRDVQLAIVKHGSAVLLAAIAAVALLSTKIIVGPIDLKIGPVEIERSNGHATEKPETLAEPEPSVADVIDPGCIPLSLGPVCAGSSKTKSAHES